MIATTSYCPSLSKKIEKSQNFIGIKSNSQSIFTQAFMSLLAATGAVSPVPNTLLKTNEVPETPGAFPFFLPD